MNSIVYPDYSHSNLNLLHSILQSYGMETKFPRLKHIPNDWFSCKHKIVMLLDGFGMNLVNQYRQSACSFLADHLVEPITTIFPSTTTAVIPSLLSGKTPLQHGTIGWTLFLKEFGRLINYLPLTDTTSGEIFSHEDYPVYELVGTNGFFQELHRKRKDVELHYISPDYIAKSPFSSRMVQPAKIHPYDHFEDMLFLIEGICRTAKRETCIVCYCNQPDALEHENGVFSKEVKNYLSQINKKLITFCKNMQGSDAELVITSDHGLIDIDEYLIINEIPELFEACLLPPFPEPRFISFFLKTPKISQFLDFFSAMQTDFMLLSKQDFLQKRWMGTGKKHPKIDDLIGDYVAIATGKKAIVMKYPNKKDSILLKAHHSGLTGHEMMVPFAWKKL